MLQQSLRQLAALPLTAPTTETLSRADALAGQDGATSPHFAIQTAGTPKRGFYHTFREWRDNTTSKPDYTCENEHIPHAGPRWAGTDEVQVAYLRTDAKHQRTLVGRNNIWSLSDGKEMLIAYRGRFHPDEVHLASGHVLPAQEAGQTDAIGFQKMPDTARVYVFRRADSPKDRAVTLDVNGQADEPLPACQ